MYNIINKTAELYATGAMMEPPPVVTQQITRWAQKMYLGHILYVLQKNGENVKEVSGAGQTVREPVNLLDKPHNEIFPFDTAGWKYEKVLHRFEDYPELRMDVRVDIVPMVFVAGPGRLGQWMEAGYVMDINVPTPTEQDLVKPTCIPRLMNSLYDGVRHELIHASQSLITGAMYEKQDLEHLQNHPADKENIDPLISPHARTLQFGMPPRKVRPKRDPAGYVRSPITQKRLKKERQIHQLRDVEFYPSLLDTFYRFKRYVTLHSLIFPGEYPLNKAIKIYVGTIKAEKNFITSTFFKKLKQHSVPKWRKAVKEFINAVMNDKWIKENLV